jgi:radical SAM protein with 4Fe4S-binding SPASM domain
LTGADAAALARRGMRTRSTAEQESSRKEYIVKYEWVQFELKELKFVKSRKDLRIFLEKAAYLVPRALGLSKRYTPAPYSLQVEPTNHCNLHCLSCARPGSVRKRGYMDFALFRQLTDSAAEMGVKMIRLWCLGEPMLHPQVVEMIAYVKRKGLRVRLTTNGTLFDGARMEGILRAGVDSGDRVVFSVLGYSKETHERVMRGVDHSQVVNNIHESLALRKKHGCNGPIIETIFYAMPENRSEAEQFRDYWRSVVDHVRVEGISQGFADFGKAGGNSSPVRTKTCTDLWDRMIVFWNGDVPRCIGDLDATYRLGNIRERSLVELWNCRALMELRRMHREKRFAELPLCNTCDWY